MTDDRQDPVVRRGALTLSYLALTPNSGLDAFTKRKVACDSVDTKQVTKMREVLDALGYAVASPSRDDWRKVEQAWEILKDIKRPAKREAEAPAETPQEADAPPEKPLEKADRPTRPSIPAARRAPTSTSRPQPATNVVSPAASAASAPPAPKAEEPTPAEDSSSVGETAFLDAAALFGSPTPFQEAAPIAPPGAASFGEAHSDVGATGAIDAAEVAAALQQLPTATSLPMELNDYASLVAHTEFGGPAAEGETRQQRHAQHNISDDAQRTAIDVTFSDYFREHPAIFKKFTAALDQWRAWLKGSR